jgi:predicted TIM-barrel fold metal-dependent hydrolase
VKLDRRSFVAGAAALAGCRGGRFGGGGGAPMPFADAHVHLFNASDLPAGKFVKYVLIPHFAPGAPEWAAALADWFVNFVKPTAVSVEAEEAGAAEALAVAHAQPPADFGRDAARYVEERTGGEAVAAEAAPDADLKQSYAAFLGAVRAAAGMAAEASASGSGDNARAFQRIAEAAEADDLLVAEGAPDRNRGAALSGEALGVGAVFRLVGWAYLMLKSRRAHLDSFLKRYGSPSDKPVLIANHLVDYDMWLDDAPDRRSGHLAQIRLMAKIAAEERGRVELRTFAGFCPLKHALEVASGNRPTTLERLQALYLDGQVAGFKMYPPMGFRAIGNGSLTDDDFDPKASGRTTARDRWRPVGTGSLGQALDRSLRHFYTWAVDHDAPILAHAGPGNAAGPGYGERANPAFWEQALREFPLRLSLGHLVYEAQPFVVVAEGGPPDPSVWALQSSIRMMSTAPPARGQVYGDLGFMPELAADRVLARRFFKALRAKFGEHDPQLTRILYGSDWIMLGYMPNYGKHMIAMKQAMNDVGYSREQMENILYRNARRFLKLES